MVSAHRRDAVPALAVAFDPDVPDLRGPIRYMWWLARCQRRRVLLGAFYGSFWMVSLAVPPLLLARAIDDGLESGDVASNWMWALALLAVGVLNAWSAISRHRTMTRIRMEASFRTNRVVIDQVNRLGADLDRLETAGELATIGIRDVATTSAALTVTGPGVGAVVSYVVVGVLVAAISVQLAVFVLLGVPVLAVLIGPLLGRVLGAQHSYRDCQSLVSAQLIDVVRGLRVLNSFGGKQQFASRFRDQSARLRDRGYEVAATTSWISGLAVGLPAVFLAGVTWMAARLASDATITTGQLVAVYGYAAMLVIPVSQLIEGAEQISRATISARRIIGFLSAEPTRSRGDDSGAPPADWSELVDPASGVRLEPGRLTALVSARPGESVAVVQRLGRLVDSEAMWDATRLTSIPLERFRERVLVADHEAHVFGGTLRSVLQGHTRADDRTIEEAIHVAAAEDVVQALPDGLDSIIDEQASNLSGGQRQRVRLARALLADPEILLAVEPTSSLDAYTESIVIDRLRASRAGRTTAVTTTSTLVLAQADTVLFLVNGALAASGTHEELLAQCGEYLTTVSRAGDPDLAPTAPATSGRDVPT